MQLVAYGAQDVYLTADPQITFWKVMYRRHTNFAMESIEQVFNGEPDFGKKVTCTISRNGDLIHQVYLQVALPEVSVPDGCSCFFRWVNYVGHMLISEVEVEIGGQRMDKHYGDWLNIWNELTQQPGHYVGYDNMVGNTVHLTGTGLRKTESTTLYIPLQFWFCRNPGLALPLIALQYHEVKITVVFRRKDEVYVVSDNDCVYECGSNAACQVCVPSLEYASLWVNYIYLDTDERRKFAQVSHEYLIEQLQFTGDQAVQSTNVQLRLNFNHPVKELIWVCQRNDVISSGYNQWNNYTDDFDSDFAWGTGPQYNGVFTNVESGYSATSFPRNYTNTGAQNDTGFDNLDGLLANAGVTTDEVAPLLDQLNNFPSTANGQSRNFGPGAAANFLVPVNMSSITTTAQGADHAGLGPRNAGRNPVVRAKLQLNGHDRFQERLGSYFNLVQPYECHTNIPATGINVYSFALKPEEHQPSGTCNFSRIDNATLQLQITPKAAGQGNFGLGTNNQVSSGSRVRVYATNYNVLRIMSGMGGTAFAN